MDSENGSLLLASSLPSLPGPKETPSPQVPKGNPMGSTWDFWRSDKSQPSSGICENGSHPLTSHFPYHWQKGHQATCGAY